MRRSVPVRRDRTSTSGKTTTKRPQSSAVNHRRTTYHSCPYFERLAEEKSGEISELKRNNYRYADVVATAIFEVAFEISSAIAQYFEMPPFRSRRRVRNVLDDLGDGAYACRFFLKHPTLPDAFMMQFGPHHDLKPGVAVCRMNTGMNSEEQSIVRKEWRHCMTRDDVLSPGVIYPWFTREIIKVLRLMKFRELDEYSENSHEEMNPGASIVFTKEGQGIKVLIWRETKLTDSPKPSENQLDKPLEVLFIPCVKGAGWPGGVNIQHAFPKQKPFVAKGTETLRRLANLVEDGRAYDLWVLEPRASTSTADSIHWTVSLRRTIAMLISDLVSGLRDPELDRSVDVGRLRGVIDYLKRRHDLSAFSDDVIDSAILWTVKRHLPSVRVTSEMFLRTMEFLAHVAQTKSCPFFLMPNLNIFRVDSLEEAKKAEKIASDLLKAVAKDDSYFLKYLGFKTKTEVHEERKRKLYSHLNRNKIRSAIVLLNMKRRELYE